MKLLSWNINGLRAISKKSDFAKLALGEYDFIGFQEIKAKEEQFPKELFSLPFKHICANPAKRPGYSGVLSLTNMSFNTQKAMFTNDDEGRVLEHRFDKYVLFNIYFPNGQKDALRLAFKMDFYEKFLAYVKVLLKQGLEVIICGDVNTAHCEIDLANPKANSKTSGFLPMERAWIDALLQAGFIDSFRAVHGDVPNNYSWWSYRSKARERNVGWRIDYFFISKGLLSALKDAFIRTDLYGSDHAPVGIELDI